MVTLFKWHFECEAVSLGPLPMEEPLIWIYHVTKEV